MPEGYGCIMNIHFVFLSVCPAASTDNVRFYVSTEALTESASKNLAI